MKFLKYEKANAEDKFLGIATISLYDKIVLKYKIVMKKDGSAFFPAAPSLKQPGTTDEYVSAFIIDSNSEKEEIEGFIRHHVKLAMQVEQSAQAANTSIAPNPYGQQQQTYAQMSQQGQARPAPLPAQQSIFDDSNVPF
jgi:hypothetical protein